MTTTGNVLTPRERLVVQLRYADGWTFEEIARGIGVASATVRKSHAAALRKMACRAALGYEPAPIAVEARSA